MEDFDPDVDAAWQNEVARRWQEIQDGRVIPPSWEVVREQIHRDLARNGQESQPPKKDRP